MTAYRATRYRFSILLTAMLGCAGATEAVAPPNMTRPLSLSMTYDTPTNDRADFGDVFARLLPSIEDAALATELRARLNDFSEASRTNDIPGAQIALRGATALLARSSIHPATIGAIRLSIVRVEESMARQSGSVELETPP